MVRVTSFTDQISIVECNGDNARVYKKEADAIVSLCKLGDSSFKQVVELACAINGTELDCNWK